MSRLFHRPPPRESRGEAKSVDMQMSRILIAPRDQVDPLLARRLTQLEASMARLAKAHSETLREREALSREVEALKTELVQDRPDPDSSLDLKHPESVI